MFHFFNGALKISNDILEIIQWVNNRIDTMPSQHYFLNEKTNMLS